MFNLLPASRSSSRNKSISRQKALILIPQVSLSLGSMPNAVTSCSVRGTPAVSASAAVFIKSGTETIFPQRSGVQDEWLYGQYVGTSRTMHKKSKLIPLYGLCNSPGTYDYLKRKRVLKIRPSLSKVDQVPFWWSLGNVGNFLLHSATSTHISCQVLPLPMNCICF